LKPLLDEWLLTIATTKIGTKALDCLLFFFDSDIEQIRNCGMRTNY